MTINKVATKSGVPRSSLKNILYGKSINPGVVTLKMICDGLNISLKDFFDSEEFTKINED
ncbi:MAG: helix-turn-helix transcriptional regulator [Clostridia bacterium]|nr:helix-turn-helix transcriptional regulator [Clostridia bacterium]